MLKNRLTTFFLLILLAMAGGKPLPGQSTAGADSLLALSARHERRDSAFFDDAYRVAWGMAMADPVQAMELCNSLEEVAGSLNDQIRLGKAYNMRGSVYRMLGNANQAMQYYQKARTQFEEAGDLKWQANILSNIGGVYFNDEKYDLSMDAQRKALQIREEIGYMKGVSGIYNSMGNIYQSWDSLEAAHAAYQQALEMAELEGDRVTAAMVTGNIGNLYGKEEKYDKCLELGFKALAIHRELAEGPSIARDLHNIGEAYNLAGKPDSAIFFNKLSWDMADSLDLPYVRRATAHTIMQSYENRRQYQQAYEWSKKAMELETELNEGKISEEVQAAEVRYNIRKAEEAIRFAEREKLMQQEARLREQELVNERQEAENNRQRTFLIGSLVALGLVGVVLILIYRQYRQKQIHNDELEAKVQARTEELQESNAQLNAEMAQRSQAQEELQKFIYRSSHDLKGPLTSLKGLLPLAKDHPEQFLPAMSAKVDRLDVILQQLVDKTEIEHREVQRQGVDVPQLLEDVRAALPSAYGAEAVDIRFEGLRTGQTVSADPYLLAVILRELLANAVLFRTGEEDAPILVRVTGEGSRWQLKVSDRGMGMSSQVREQCTEMFFRGHERSLGGGLGLYLVRVASERMGATWMIESREGEGTTVSIELGQ